MRSGQKVVLAGLIGLVIVLTGSYALMAQERGNPTAYSETPVYEPMEPATPVNAAEVVPDLDIELKSEPVTVIPAESSKPAPVTTTRRTATPKPAPIFRDMILAGTTVAAKSASYLHLRTALPGDPVIAVTLDDVIVDGQTVIPAGTTVFGEVTRLAPFRVAFNQIGGFKTSLSLTAPDVAQRAAVARSMDWNYLGDNFAITAGEILMVRFNENVSL